MSENVQKISGIFGSVFEILSEAVRDSMPKNSCDYIENGLLFCGICHKAKQTSISFLGEKKIVFCICDCGKAECDREDKRMKELEAAEKLRAAKRDGIQDLLLQKCTFETADSGNSAVTQKAKKYVADFDKMRRENIGLLLWGGVGTGKTFIAACIANALIEQEYSVLMTDFSKIINALSNFSNNDKNAYIARICNYSLLVIDDLGTERQSDFALSIVENVIDERYKSGKPMIITTNLTVSDLENPPNIKYQRTYSRILARCMPIKVVGADRRKSEAESRFETIKRAFEG